MRNSTDYTIPLAESARSSSVPSVPPERRPSQSSNLDNRLRQLEKENEELTHSNVRLLRANRILKLDSDRVVDEQVNELKEEIKHLKYQNVRLQRSNRLLQEDLNQHIMEKNQVREDQIRNMKTVGPEYEYLVQIINLLYRQLQGKATCDKTCCFTDKPLSEGFSVLTLPPDDSDEQEAKPQHICRPSIRSHITSGDLAVAREHENSRLRQDIESMKADRDALDQLIQEKEEDIQMLKNELQMKDTIVSQLEKDFERMEVEVVDLQKEWRHSDRFKSSSSFSDIHAFPTPPPKDSPAYKLPMPTTREYLAEVRQ
ncbi:hypothetical protein LRAMOSA05647 [Lichtheimia ramosa]|uniref:Uncharacterized protein n=1 Tax=Lichtheimia ramosa TaxID=688394 RepID=A0A077X0V7_9FUNG|nr:hypothetical protein LRAMOSA05647 [Lichtheimia ramosa]